MSALFAFRPMTVYDISCPPREAFERCMGFWATVGIRSETPGMGDQFAMRGWTGTELATGNTGKAFLVDAIASTTTTGHHRRTVPTGSTRPRQAGLP